MNEEEFDVAVVGAGFGGIYAVHRFREQGLSVVGIEGAAGVGGTWYHNGYPGSRVDTDSVDMYSYLFSREIYDGWQWKERYATQSELMAHLNWVADKLNVRNSFRFNTWLRSAVWSEEDQRWHLKTDRGDRVACRFLVMCTGNLSEPKPVPFAGVENFRGEWYQTNRWPHKEVSFEGKRVAIVGTGSSGVQAVPVVAEQAAHLYVFQRTPHFAVPAQNGPSNFEKQQEISRILETFREAMLARPTLPWGQEDRRRADQYTPEERLERLERQWAYGGHGLAYVFEDIGTNRQANEIVGEFVRNKIRERVKDPEIAAKLCPTYPIGTRRLILEIGYYECFNRDNVTLVDMREDPIQEITETGIRTHNGQYDVDTIIFALGFHAFLGAIDRAGVVNHRGQTPREIWARGPRTVFGLMTPGFPNLFHPTNAGSPSVLGPLILENEFHVEWIVDCIEHMRRSGYASVEATEEGAEIWGGKSAAVAENMLRRQEDNYMVHVNADDGSRIFQPWAAGMATYVPEVRRMTERGYEGFAFRRATARSDANVIDEGAVASPVAQAE
jgi:cation diffusion facilitator CzcD-associated flavoprotein CzcO